MLTIEQVLAEPVSATANAVNHTLAEQFEILRTAAKREKSAIDAEIAALEARAAVIRKRGVSNAPKLEALKNQAQQERSRSLDTIRMAISQHCSTISPQEQIKASQCSFEFHGLKSINDCLNFGEQSDRHFMYSGLGAITTALIATGQLINNVPHLISPLFDLKPFVLYALATKLDLASEAVAAAKESSALVDAIATQLITSTLQPAPQAQAGRYIADLSREDFLLTFGDASFFETYQQGLKNPELNAAFQEFKSASDYKFYRTAANSVG
ncbi:MAG: hypothetical protein ACRC1W_17185 [Shewanella sp.]